jgi:sortase A
VRGIKSAFSTKTLERWLLAIGVLLCFIFLAAMGYRATGSRLALREFRNSKRTGEAVRQSQPVRIDKLNADYALWSPKRIIAYKATLARQFAPAVAVLRVPKLGVEVPVFDGTDDLILDRGAGRIDGTAQPGEPGNIGIAGHRDGFFRPLKDIAVGDQVILESQSGVADYAVERITIVDPTDVSVLAPTPSPYLTLVTCYPFYFVGDAPQRYIVRCSLTAHAATTGKEEEKR